MPESCRRFLPQTSALQYTSPRGQRPSKGFVVVDCLTTASTPDAELLFAKTRGGFRNDGNDLPTYFWILFANGEHLRVVHGERELLGLARPVSGWLPLSISALVDQIRAVVGAANQMKTDPSLDGFLRIEDKNWMNTPHTLTEFHVMRDKFQKGGRICRMELETGTRRYIVYRESSIPTGSNPCVTWISGNDVKGVFSDNGIQFAHQCCISEEHPKGLVVVDEWAIDPKGKW